jgi:uncharacterized protein (TIGR00730 family)
MQNITVFGGSQPKPGDPAYEAGLRLGRQLAEAGYTVLTGGYIGTMEAVSRGAAEAGGTVVGVTCDEIEDWRPIQRNAWVKEERRYPTLRERMFSLIDSCDAAIALPGGPGTLAEISVMWSHLSIGAIAPRPLVLIGSGWQTTFTQFFDTLGAYIPHDQRRWLHFAAEVDHASAYLSDYFQLKNTS